jgi:predicted ester cyclase
MNDRPHDNMRGFDPEFGNLDEYIRVITARIWEQRRIDDIHLYYSDPCVVETPSSMTTGIDDVIRGTHATLAQFPDRRLLAEDIIQSGDAEGGYLSSHRIISTMTHLGGGAFGAPTGRRIHVRTIADCVCRENRIIHEWLVRDQGAIARQIGLAPIDLARQWLAQRGGWNKPAAPPPPTGYVSHVSAAAAACDYAAAIESFNRGTSGVARHYDDAVHQIGPGGETRYGQDEVAIFWRSLFTALEVGTFRVEHLALQRGGGRAERVAMRWRAQTLHRGDGVLGTATGRPVEVLGINHAEFYRGRVLREWVLIDEVALWMQVLATQQ